MQLDETIRRVELLVSSYCNGFAKFAPSAQRTILNGSREILLQQLSALAHFVLDQKNHDDKELLASSVAICQRYFDYFQMILAQSWGSQLNVISAIPVQTLEIFSAAHHLSEEEFREKLRSDVSNMDSQDERLENFLGRYVVARAMLNEVIEEMGLSSEQMNRDRLVRSIIFPPEFKQAGMAILAYFGEIIEKKYPDMDCKVQIVQEGNRVSLIIETPNGKIERIEHELSEYALVVTGNYSAEEYMPNALDALALRQKLQLAQLEVKQTKELLYVERQGYERRIDSLEDQIGFIRNILDKTQYEASQASMTIRNIASSYAGETVAVLNRLADAIEKNQPIDSSELAKELQIANANSPGILDKLNELFIKGAIQGASGNYLYAALQTLQKMGFG